MDYREKIDRIVLGYDRHSDTLDPINGLPMDRKHSKAMMNEYFDEMTDVARRLLAQVLARRLSTDPEEKGPKSYLAPPPTHPTIADDPLMVDLNKQIEKLLRAD